LFNAFFNAVGFDSNAFALELSFISDVWPVINGDGYRMPDLQQFRSVTVKAEKLKRFLKDNGIIIEHCPSVTASSETPSANPDNDNKVSSYANLKVYDWIREGLQVKLGTDGIWYTGNRPRTLSEEIVRLLLARPNEMKMSVALSLVDS
jgi:hypothetical protein